MNFFLVLLASIFISLAWLIPIHYRPWVTFTGEFYSFLALLSLSLLFFKNKIYIPRISLGIVALACIPFVQLLFGQVFFFSNAFMASLYLLGFWFAILIGYNLSRDQSQRENTFTIWCYVLLASGVVTAFMAMCQWLNLDEVIPGIARLVNARPYANFAQPNNMATFLLMALLACLYLYETKKIKTVWLVSATFVMLMSLALSQSRTSWVACACVIAYLIYQQYKGYVTIKWYTLFAWLGLFIGLIFLFPILGGYLSQFSETQIKSVDIARRATGDMSRLAIWQQMLHAVQHKPWFGYGWYQSGVAYTTISEFHQGPVWVRSAHNFILDFLLWNGLLIGLPFLAYFGYLAYQLQKYTQSIESIIGILMIGVFTVHAMLEFPQNYAYFLLPIGFVIGIVQAQKMVKNDIAAPILFSRLCIAVGVVLAGVVFREYDVSSTQLSNATKYQRTPELAPPEKPIYVLNEFTHRIEFIKLDANARVSDEYLDTVKHIVLLYPTSANIYKYAKLLAVNGKEDEAKRQLKMLKLLRNTDIPYEKLLEK